MMRLALVQLAVTANRATNLESALKAVSAAAANGAHMVALPECFNSPYGTKYFADYAEPIPGPCTDTLAQAARRHKLYIIGGSIPERDGSKLYNTCTVFDPSGNMVAKHRKIHLFDIDVPDGIKFQESETLSPGDKLTTFDTPYGKVGVGICYDIRFPELAQLYAQRGCQLLCYPGAFNMTTGPAHWELLQRSRALDNQLFVATISPARDLDADYIAWGHSTVVDPWGKVVATTGEKPDLLFADLDFTQVSKVRQSIPVQQQKRHDLYKLQDLSAASQ